MKYQIATQAWWLEQIQRSLNRLNLLWLSHIGATNPMMKEYLQWVEQTGKISAQATLMYKVPESVTFSDPC